MKEVFPRSLRADRREKGKSRSCAFRKGGGGDPAVVLLAIMPQGARNGREGVQVLISRAPDEKEEEKASDHHVAAKKGGGLRIGLPEMSRRGKKSEGLTP